MELKDFNENIDYFMRGTYQVNLPSVHERALRTILTSLMIPEDYVGVLDKLFLDNSNAAAKLIILRHFIDDKYAKIDQSYNHWYSVLYHAATEYWADRGVKPTAANIEAFITCDSRYQELKTQSDEYSSFRDYLARLDFIIKDRKEILVQLSVNLRDNKS